MGPSILQAIMREPTRSYQDIYDPNRPPSHRRQPGSSGFSSPSTSRPSSIRSSGSATSTHGPAWVNGQWEWSNFQGRKGLTGGTRSLYTPSVVGRSLGLGGQARAGTGAQSVRSAGGSIYEGSEDGRSVTSGASASGSVRTFLSAPGGERRTKKKGTSSRDAQGGVAAPPQPSGYDRSSRSRSLSNSSSTTALEARRSSRFDSAPPLLKSQSSRLSSSGGADQPSRRYSSAVSTSSSTSPPLRPSLPTSPTLSSSSSPSRSKSPRSHLSSGATTPSLTSSSSSALSSEPRTPIHAVADPYLPALALEADKPRKVKKSRSSKLVPLEAVQAVEPTAAVEPAVQEIRAPAAASTETPTSNDSTTSPVPVPGRFYSVDEIFGAAAPTEAETDKAGLPEAQPKQHATLPVPSPFLAADPLPSPFLEAAPPLAPQAVDDNVITDDSTGAPAVPRLKLTRTESEQSRIGVRGSVELEVDEADKGDSPVREKPVRRSMDEVEEEDEDEQQSSSEDETDSSEYDEDEVPTPEEPAQAIRAPRVSPSPAPTPAPAPPVLARFVKDKRARSGRPTPEPVVSRAPNLQPVYEVVKSSRPSRSYAPSSVSSFDAQPRSSSPANSDVSGSSGGSYAYGASTDVPDWLDRIRTLGEPIQPLVTSQAPQPKHQLNPPPHWTVQQLRSGGGSGSSVSSNGSSNGGRPSMPRPRSVRSLRSRAKVLEGLPEEAEAEAEAVAADEFDRRSVLSTTATLSASPVWVRKDGVSPAGSIRTASSSANGLSRSSSLADRSASDGPASHRRARSMDMERPRMQALSPLSRSTSTSTSASRPASTKTSSSYDFEAIAASGPKPKGFSKFLQPPLASSKAVREPTPVVVRNARTSSLRASSLYEPTSPRPSSLYDASPTPRRSLEDESDDGRSVSGLSMISVMSAPQLTPVRPPKNPARRLSSSSLIRPAVPFPAESLLVDPPSRTQSPAGSIRSGLERSAPSFASFDQRTPRLSASFSAVERPIMQRPVVAPPPPAPPITTAPPAEPTFAASDVTRSTSLASRSRPVSSYLPPSATSATPTSLAIARRFDGKQQKTSRRFGLFRRSNDGENGSSGNKRRFEPSLDLTYDSLDANFMRKRIRSDELVVEVIAASLDRWDRERVWQLARGTNGVGFVPGRAVVGKVLEVGADVRRVKKGELVWGLSPLRKSGGLASLIILSRDHVAAAPASLAPELSAALPSAATSAMLIMQSLCDSLPKGSKVLVLNAHTGVGYLCLQLAHHYRPGVAGARDLWMVAQCSMSVTDGEAALREAGATDVLREEPLAAINGLHEGSFDVVIDTMGGRRLYDASRRILHNSGRFITTVGDELGESDYNTSLRSLRRAFVRKDKKQISYWRVDADGDSREAVRDTLDKVRNVVDAGALKPRVESVLPMSEARRTFDEREAELEGVVVRVREV